MDIMDEPMGLADAMMMRGLKLRHLRNLAEEDDAHRQEDNSECRDEIFILPSGSKLLNYESYLMHQTYYDDLKHVNVSFIDFGTFVCGNLIMEQDKTLGKGGLCWDAAFILGEYLVAHEQEWNSNKYHPTRVLELGSGTGLTGMIVSKACHCQVNITDLPQVVRLMKKNMYRNFDMVDELRPFVGLNFNSNDEEYFLQSYSQLKQARGLLSVNILDWAEPSTYPEDPFDIIIGADIVASLYDPIALVQTMHALSSRATTIFISGKTRLDVPHQIFETELRKRFQSVERVDITSRNRNPDVFILVIKDKI